MTLPGDKDAKVHVVLLVGFDCAAGPLQRIRFGSIISGSFPPLKLLVVQRSPQFANVPASMRTEFLGLRQFVFTKSRPNRWRFASEQNGDDVDVDVCSVRQVVELFQVFASHRLLILLDQWRFSVMRILMGFAIFSMTRKSPNIAS